MTMTPVPGYLAELTVNLIDIGIRGQVMGISFGKNAPRKPRFGQAFTNVLAGGQKFVSFSANGHIDVEGPAGALLTAFDSEDPVAFDMQVGGASIAAVGVGAFTGTCVIESLDLSADAEGEWGWSGNFLVDGAAAFTPAV